MCARVRVLTRVSAHETGGQTAALMFTSMLPRVAFE